MGLTGAFRNDFMMFRMQNGSFEFYVALFWHFKAMSKHTAQESNLFG